ncbi:HAD family hydrolase [Bacillus sp. UNC438CL73TsuS30]|uniref:HAD family hydrolase n=1 Tax=Bacillus sp. UNC438CL73TsuS30 TaxID=1340434 RepID=UPI00047DE66D|nr:HAD family hydrolase [Bacillus sp. UNC438CL73TsuS30]
MKQQTLIMDLDDTLIHCHKYFQAARNSFSNLLKGWFDVPTHEEIIQKQLEIDLKCVEMQGLHSSVFPESLVRTYWYFCRKYKRKIRNKDEDRVRKIGQNVFQQKAQPFPYMYEVLDQLLKDGHQLFLFTGGDVTNQSRKITQLDLEPYFSSGIFIFEQKNTETLLKVLNKIKSDKRTTWMIGNSLKTDIMPAIELGINAIHIPAKFEWSYNIVDIDITPNGTFAELESLLQLPDYLREYCFFNAVI